MNNTPNISKQEILAIAILVLFFGSIFGWWIFDWSIWDGTYYDNRRLYNLTNSPLDVLLVITIIILIIFSLYGFGKLLKILLKKIKSN